MTDVGLACRLDVFEGAEKAQYETLRRAMRSGMQEARELSDGYAIRLTPDPVLFQQSAQWITLERRCCPFLTLGLEWSDGDRVWLKLTGGPGVKAFLASMLASRP